MALLDTTTLPDLAGGSRSRKSGETRDRVRSLVEAGQLLTTSRLNVAELLVGVARATDPAKERRKVETVLSPLVVPEFDSLAAEAFGRIRGHLQDRGTPIGDMDALIASVCLSRSRSIVTGNAKHFRRVPGLLVETY